MSTKTNKQMTTETNKQMTTETNKQMTTETNKQMTTEKKSKDPKDPITKITTIIFIDIVDYTTITNLLSRELFNEYHDVFDEVIEKVTSKFNGAIIKKIGDAFMLDFENSSNAIKAIKLAQKKFLKFNKRKENYNTPIRIRTGMHRGIVLIRKGDLFGTSVNIASRLERMGKAGDILFSDNVKEDSKIKNYEFLGLQKIKGLEYKINVYKIKTEKNYQMQLTNLN